ncbi:hypothetical protein B0T14DRAFT_221248 [Immersiella caudata]|uniref:Uncharacterized protein n=1 Tax=Immersiella caudata TaxID=314043 RepID=A0AA39WQX6_9PEZI|nr:hypothetical protein B0T14DRAFT_221248 [Immersiella caudata]
MYQNCLGYYRKSGSATHTPFPSRSMWRSCKSPLQPYHTSHSKHPLTPTNFLPTTHSGLAAQHFRSGTTRMLHYSHSPPPTKLVESRVIISYPLINSTSIW